MCCSISTNDSSIKESCIACNVYGECNNCASEFELVGNGCILKSSVTPFLKSKAAIGYLTALLVVVSLAAFFSVRKYCAVLAERERNRKEWHIFISYRSFSDEDIAVALFNKLEQKCIPFDNENCLKIRCKKYGDKDDNITEALKALEHTCLFIPIYSEAALEQLLEKRNDKLQISLENREKDPLLTVWKSAIDLEKKERLRLFPIMVGGGNRGYTLSTTQKSSVQTRKKDEKGNIPKFNFRAYTMNQFPREQGCKTSLQDVNLTLVEFDELQGACLAHETDLSLIDKDASTGRTKADECVTEVLKLLKWKAWEKNNYTALGSVYMQKHWDKKLTNEKYLKSWVKNPDHWHDTLPTKPRHAEKKGFFF